VSRRRGAGVEVTGAGEGLADEARAHHPAAADDQAAVRLGWEEDLRQAGDGQGVGEAQEDRQDGGHEERRLELLADAVQVLSPQARPMPTRIMSISLIPAKGMATPPR